MSEPVDILRRTQSVTDPDELQSTVERLHAAMLEIENNPASHTAGDVAPLLGEAVHLIRESTQQLLRMRTRLAEEQQLRVLADERFELAYQNSPFAMSIASVAEGRFRDVNTMFLQRLGFTRDEVIGKTSIELEIFPEPEGRRWLVEALRSEGFVDGAETLVQTKDGELKRARLYARVINYNGEPCILTMTQSLEEIRRAEEEAIRLRQFYEQLLQDLPAEICIFDTAGRYLYISPSAVANPETRHWLINKTDFDFCEQRGLDRAIAERRQTWIKQAIEKREIATQEERVTGATGEARYYLRTYTPVKDQSGGISHIIAYGVDITNYKMLEEQLRHAQKMEAIARLAGGVAHDFNNLLTAMMGIADFLLPQVKGNATLETGIAEIQRAAERAADLTRQLLAFSRRQPTRNIPIDVSKIIASLESMLRRIIGETVTLRVAVEPNVAAVMGDPGQLEQIIMNLVVNARDAMPQGGELTISTRMAQASEPVAFDQTLQHTGDYVVIMVRDTGFGMDGQTIRHIFEPFFTTKAEGKGTGLGLSTVYAIVERWGGRVFVESTPETGTAFSIYLPTVSIRTESAETVARTLISTTGTETVLVVEDEDAVRDVVSRILSRCGYTVLASASGEDALSLTEHYTGPIHMLVSDMVMPGMSGRELAEQLKGHRPDIRMLFMSGHCDDNDAEFVAQLETPNFIQKPFTAVALSAKVRELLDEQRDA